MSNNKKLFSFSRMPQGELNLILISFLIFTASFYFLNKIFPSIIISLFLTLIIFFLLNKKWFNKCTFYKNHITIEYLLPLFRNKLERIEYSNIKQITYYDYMSKTPSHCTIELKNKSKIRFNCYERGIEGLRKFLLTKNIELIFFNKRDVNYRT